MAMTVRELRALLSDQPDDRPVVLAKDAEGNDFSPLSDWGEGYYTARSTWGGNVCNLNEPEERGENAVHALVLWPVN